MCCFVFVLIKKEAILNIAFLVGFRRKTFSTLLYIHVSIHVSSCGMVEKKFAQQTTVQHTLSQVCQFSQIGLGWLVGWLAKPQSHTNLSDFLDRTDREGRTHTQTHMDTHTHTHNFGDVRTHAAPPLLSFLSFLSVLLILLFFDSHSHSLTHHLSFPSKLPSLVMWLKSEMSLYVRTTPWLVDR